MLQNMIGSELPLYAERLTTCDDAGEPAGDSSTEGPRLDIRLGSDTEADAGEALLPDSAADSCQVSPFLELCFHAQYARLQANKGAIRAIARCLQQAALHKVQAQVLRWVVRMRSQDVDKG